MEDIAEDKTLLFVSNSPLLRKWLHGIPTLNLDTFSVVPIIEERSSVHFIPYVGAKYNDGRFYLTDLTAYSFTSCVLSPNPIRPEFDGNPMASVLTDLKELSVTLGLNPSMVQAEGGNTS